MDSSSRTSCIPLLLLILLLSSDARIFTKAEARPLPTPSPKQQQQQQRYMKVLQSLGMSCRCCDGAGGECRSSWDSSCAKLDCHPWKFSRF